MAALLKGYSPEDKVVDGPVSVGNRSPKNYSNKYKGHTTLSDALAHSYNSIPVKLMIDIGRSAIIETAHMAGIKGELETWAPMVLGTSALSLMDLTTGYIPFASGGFPAEPYAVLEIRRSNGDILYQRDEQERIPLRRVFPEEKVAELNTMLSAVVKSGTGRRADLGFAPQGGKTGTNQGYRDAWYIGYTGHYVTGVWYGNDDFTPMKEVTGGLIPAPTWKRIMAEAERGLQPIGLAGIPYDETYAAAAAELPAVQGPLASDERDQAAGAAIAAAAPEEDVNSVLTGMFDLFEAAPSAAAIAAAKASASKTASQEALVLPKANVDQPENSRRKNRILEQIFGGDEGRDQPKRKKKKKKTLFDSIF
jgi:penicillin-binding protein 1A